MTREEAWALHHSHAQVRETDFEHGAPRLQPHDPCEPPKFSECVRRKSHILRRARKETR